MASPQLPVRVNEAMKIYFHMTHIFTPNLIANPFYSGNVDVMTHLPATFATSLFLRFAHTNVFCLSLYGTRDSDAQISPSVFFSLSVGKPPTHYRPSKPQAVLSLPEPTAQTSIGINLTSIVACITPTSLFNPT